MKEEIDLDYKEFSVTPELFLEWRSPRYGATNPTRMDNKVWEWLIRSRKSAYRAADDLKFWGENPVWCFNRFGQSETKLPDGRTIFIAGEHEDSYDPDFYIYNDVVVINTDDSIEIYSYPESVFPPTDFHTATLVDNTIVIIGSLSYPENRMIGQTQVYLLNLEDFTINKVNTSGISLGWLYKHTAVLSSEHQSITIEKGTIYQGENIPWAENIDVWQLNLVDWRWQRLTDRQWKRWEMNRSDRKPNQLWYMRQAIWYRDMNWQENYPRDMNKLIEELGKKTDFGVLKNLYSPNIPHQNIPKNEDDEEYNVYQICIEGVIVRYVEGSVSVQVTVEGELSEEIVEILKSDLLEKFSLLENTECDIEII
jgi:hypothetical protein